MADRPSTMKAWRYSSFGGGADDLQLSEDVPVPVPGKGTVLVRVQAAGVNPVDWKLQQGHFRPVMPRETLPITPGYEVAGEVVALGPQTTGFSPGDQVFGTALFPGGSAGFGEYAVLPVSNVASRPPSVAPSKAACYGIAGLTALQALRDYGGLPLGPREGGAGGSEGGGQPKRVLIANASGGVGHYAVQLAKLAGAHVTATCGARNMEFVKALGADRVLDYKTPEGAALTPAPESEAGGGKYDMVVDGTMVLTAKEVLPVLAPEGKWLHLTPDPAFVARSVLGWASSLVGLSKQRLLPVMCKADAADLAEMARLEAEGKVATHLDAEVKFDEAPESWRKSIAGHVVGKVVVVA